MPFGGCGSAAGAESRGGAETWALAGPPPPSGGGGAGGAPASCVLPADAAHALALQFRGGGRERRVPPAGEETRSRVGPALCGRERRRRADEEEFRGGESQRGGGTNRFRRRRCRPREGADGSRRPGGGAACAGWGVPRKAVSVRARTGRSPPGWEGGGGKRRGPSNRGRERITLQRNSTS